MSHRSNLLLADGECQGNKGFEFSNSPRATTTTTTINTATIAVTIPTTTTTTTRRATR